MFKTHLAWVIFMGEKEILGLILEDNFFGNFILAII
jgi:hypothetical protein